MFICASYSSPRVGCLRIVGGDLDLRGEFSVVMQPVPAVLGTKTGCFFDRSAEAFIALWFECMTSRC